MATGRQRPCRRTDVRVEAGRQSGHRLYGHAGNSPQRATRLRPARDTRGPSRAWGLALLITAAVVTGALPPFGQLGQAFPHRRVVPPVHASARRRVVVSVGCEPAVGRAFAVGARLAQSGVCGEAAAIERVSFADGAGAEPSAFRCSAAADAIAPGPLSRAPCGLSRQGREASRGRCCRRAGSYGVAVPRAGAAVPRVVGQVRPLPVRLVPRAPAALGTVSGTMPVRRPPGRGPRCCAVGRCRAAARCPARAPSSAVVLSAAARPLARALSRLLQGGGLGAGPAAAGWGA